MRWSGVRGDIFMKLETVPVDIVGEAGCVGVYLVVVLDEKIVTFEGRS